MVLVILGNLSESCRAVLEMFDIPSPQLPTVPTCRYRYVSTHTIFFGKILLSYSDTYQELPQADVFGLGFCLG